MNHVWQFLSSTVFPETWLTGNTATLVAMLVLSGAMAIVGYAQMYGEHRYSLRMGATTLIVGVIAGATTFLTWDYLRTMNWWENLSRTTESRISTLITLTGISGLITAFLIFAGYYVTTWNHSQASDEEKQSSYVGQFMIGAGWLFALHVVFMWMRISNEQRAIDASRTCNNGVCIWQGNLAMMPMWLMLVLGVLGATFMLWSLRGVVMWRSDERMPIASHTSTQEQVASPLVLIPSPLIAPKRDQD